MVCLAGVGGAAVWWWWGGGGVLAGTNYPSTHLPIVPIIFCVF